MIAERIGAVVAVEVTKTILRRKVEKLETKVERLELENEVMRKFINHKAMAQRFGGIVSLIEGGGKWIHDDGCEPCTRLVSTFFPATPWRGWSL